MVLGVICVDIDPIHYGDAFMIAFRKAIVAAIFLVVPLAALAPARGQGITPLSEVDITKLVELQIDDDVIAAKLKKVGVGFVVDESAIARLKKAGATEGVLAAVRGALSSKSGRAGGKAISYQDVVKLLQLGLDENEILKRLDRSPTIFTLDAAQVTELKGAGATEGLLAAMQRGRANPTPERREGHGLCHRSRLLGKHGRALARRAASRWRWPSRSSRSWSPRCRRSSG